jgi:hypothetical protein
MSASQAGVGVWIGLLVSQVQGLHIHVAGCKESEGSQMADVTGDDI